LSSNEFDPRRQCAAAVHEVSALAAAVRAAAAHETSAVREAEALAATLALEVAARHVLMRRERMGRHRKAMKLHSQFDGELVKPCFMQ
jgi:hypothetical protein